MAETYRADWLSAAGAAARGAMASDPCELFACRSCGDLAYECECENPTLPQHQALTEKQDAAAGQSGPVRAFPCEAARDMAPGL